MLTILHVSSEIHAFFLAALALGLEISQMRAADIPSSIVEVVGG